MHWKGGGYPPLPGRPSLCSATVRMTHGAKCQPQRHLQPTVTAPNRFGNFLQPPRTAFEVPSLLMRPLGGGGHPFGPARPSPRKRSPAPPPPAPSSRGAERRRGDGVGAARRPQRQHRVRDGPAAQGRGPRPERVHRRRPGAAQGVPHAHVREGRPPHAPARLRARAHRGRAAHPELRRARGGGVHRRGDVAEPADGGAGPGAAVPGTPPFQGAPASAPPLFA